MERRRLFPLENNVSEIGRLWPANPDTLAKRFACSPTRYHYGVSQTPWRPHGINFEVSAWHHRIEHIMLADPYSAVGVGLATFISDPPAQ